MPHIDDVGTVLSPLQIINYKVDTLNYSPGAANLEEERDLEAILDLSFLPHKRSGDSHGMRMLLELQEREGEGEQKDSFELSITITGHFEFIDDSSERPDPERLRQFFFTTAVGTLYGILREKVRTITAQSNSQGIVIPIVNLGALAKDLEEEEDLEHFNFEDTSDDDTDGG